MRNYANIRQISATWSINLVHRPHISLRGTAKDPKKWAIMYQNLYTMYSYLPPVDQNVFQNFRTVKNNLTLGTQTEGLMLD